MTHVLEFELTKTLHGANGGLPLAIAGRIEAGQTLALFGPSGSGKTTVLRMLAGLTPPDAGRITIGNALWFDADRHVDRPTEHRLIGMQFQQAALFPNMPALTQLEFAGATPAEAMELLERVELEGFARRKPAALSGGQQQRLALARALARRAPLLLLDEPLSAQDAALRVRVQDRLRDLQRERGFTLIVASHDVAEIVRIADEVWQLDAGRVVTRGTPTAVLLGGHPVGIVLTIEHDHVLVSIGGGVLRLQLAAAEMPTLFAGAPLELTPQRLAAAQR
ncbi:ATP-binding cassette domain-containing protein [Andreprevotia chitinilytica]|uniref:ATP-binding cassette domain-containing protein n=1 Tax=Andreprevotia chitinilytica TaxID=396808 RepID=UPI00068A52C7|nr:ATP-binding cassette domain-containing protein [Andreprevotia chitinilytica]